MAREPYMALLVTPYGSQKNLISQGLSLLLLRDFKLFYSQIWQEIPNTFEKARPAHVYVM